MRKINQFIWLCSVLFFAGCSKVESLSSEISQKETIIQPTIFSTEEMIGTKELQEGNTSPMELTPTNVPSEFPVRLDLVIAGDAPIDYEWFPDGSSLLLGAQNIDSFLLNITPDLKKWSLLASGDDNMHQTGIRPSWSADGNWIAYCEATGTRPMTIKGSGASMPYYDVFKIRKDGSEKQQITQIEADFCQPKWSSDGKTIAVFWTRNEKNHLGIMSIDGGLNEIILKFDTGAGSWSPDGKALAVTGTINPTDGNCIFLIQPDGNNLRQVPGIIGVIGVPQWSRDGKSLIYMREDGIYIADITGGKNQKLTDGMLYDSQSVLSPDGNWITFSSDRTGKYQVYVIRIDGTDLLTYQHSGLEDLNPIWSPDGKRLTFFSHESGSSGNIILVPLSLFTPV